MARKKRLRSAASGKLLSAKQASTLSAKEVVAEKVKKSYGYAWIAVNSKTGRKTAGPMRSKPSAWFVAGEKIKKVRLVEV